MCLLNTYFQVSIRVTKLACVIETKGEFLWYRVSLLLQFACLKTEACEFLLWKICEIMVNIILSKTAISSIY